jgi:hypothetical protein
MNEENIKLILLSNLYKNNYIKRKDNKNIMDQSYHSNQSNTSISL